MGSNLLINILGWIGAAAVLAAYGLVSTKKLAGDSLIYQGLNILGGLLLIVNSFYYGAIPSVTVNVAWIGIAVFSLVRSRGGAREA